MRAYAPAFERPTVSELARLARDIYREDLENGYVTVLAEMVAGGLADAELGAEVAARLQPWIDMLERKLEQVIAGSPLEPSSLPRDGAFAIVRCTSASTCSATCDGDHARAESLLDLGVELAPLALSLLLPPREDDV